MELSRTLKALFENIAPRGVASDYIELYNVCIILECSLGGPSSKTLIAVCVCVCVCVCVSVRRHIAKLRQE